VRPVAARPVVSRPVQTVAARRDVPAGFRREPLKGQHPARPSAAARKVRALQATEEAEAMVAQRLAQAERLARPALRAAVVAAGREVQQGPQVAAAQPTAVPGELAASDVVGRQPVAVSAAAARRLEVAAGQGGAEVVQRRAAGPASVAVRLQVAGAPDAVAVRLRVVEAPDAEVRRPAARDGAVLLLAAAWAGPPSTRRRGDRLGRSARARSAHARGCLRTAQP
jgi:hypothetical protein